MQKQDWSNPVLFCYNDSMEIQNLIVYILAVWRIANLFVNERGPFDLFLKIRSVAGITHDENGFALEIPETFFGQLLSCVWCSSIWIALFITVLWFVSSEWALRFAVIFALSGGAVLLEEWRKGIK